MGRLVGHGWVHQDAARGRRWPRRHVRHPEGGFLPQHVNCAEGAQVACESTK